MAKHRFHSIGTNPDHWVIPIFGENIKKQVSNGYKRICKKYNVPQDPTFRKWEKE